ncbi:class I SAM-dependent methyltransferase [Streptomyces sp. NPDC003006]
MLQTADHFQGKAGRFSLERCRRCGHIFQNPRLTQEGLDFYYRDFYDGHGEALLEFGFRSLKASYRGRVRLCAAHGVTPTAWLDVGSGYGHFCGYARRRWPDTVFHGLDQGAGIERGVRLGWLDRALRGRFADLAGELPQQYDVVSMHNYLEHTRDPHAELDAALRALAPGGHLLVEVPDPRWPMARLMRGRCLPVWCQPQHQHLMPAKNLVKALTDRGLVVLGQERGSAHQWFSELSPLVFFGCVKADPLAPWKPKASPARRAAWPAIVAAAALAMPAALTFDAFAGLVARLGNQGNAYRLLARKAD